MSIPNQLLCTSAHLINTYTYRLTTLVMDMELLRVVLLLSLVPHILLLVLTVMRPVVYYVQQPPTCTAGNTGLYSAYGTGTYYTSIGIWYHIRNHISIYMDTATIRWTVPSDYCGPSRTFMITVAQGSNPAVCSGTTSQTYYSCQGLMSSQFYNISVTITISSGGSEMQSSPSTATYSHPCFITNAPKAIFNFLTMIR